MLIDTIDSDEDRTRIMSSGRRDNVRVVPEKKKGGKNILGKIFLVLLLLVIGYGAYFGIRAYRAGKKVGLNLTPTDIINTVTHKEEEKQPELKKDSTGNYTNVLIIGVDTRDEDTSLNTDTVILASYNYTTNEVVMISIPRDFHVETYKGSHWYNRINAIYNIAEGREKGSGMQALCDTVTEVTGQEIQYYAMLNFHAFRDIVDALGGIEIDVENSFTDYSYPTYDYKWQTISFDAGLQKMDGERALQYARSRHSADNGEGSDFMRARRQQKVITAVEEKIMSSSTFANPNKILNILDAVADNLRVSPFTLSDITAAINIGKKFMDGGKTYSLVLDPSAGAKRLIEVKTMESGAYAIGPTLGFGKYTEILKYIDLAMKDPAFYSEQADVYVYDNGYGYNATYNKVLEMEKAYPYTDITFIAVLNSDKEGTYVYSPDAKFPETARSFTEYLQKDGSVVTNTRPDYVRESLGSGNLVILLGKEPAPTTDDPTVKDTDTVENGI